MSWQAYVDQTLLGSKKVARGAILGQKGGVWATSAGYALSKEEQNFLVKTAFNVPGDAQSKGITLANTKFMCIRADDEELIGRKGEKGCFVSKTKQAIIVGEYDPGTPAGDASLAVSKLVDYLKSQGF